MTGEGKRSGLPAPKFKTREWGSVACDSERCKSNVLSWFGGLVPDAWGLPLAADIQVEVATDRETAIRALFRLPDGALRQAIRTFGVRTSKIKLGPASGGILQTYSAKAALSKAESR